MPEVYQTESPQKSSPSKEKLDDLFVYREGRLYWRDGLDNQINAGDEAGSLNGQGYVMVSLKRKRYPVHRLVWIMHGNEPSETIDHINGNRSDNRIENLRAATNAENVCNSKLRKDNSSGIKGVSWRPQSRKWSGKVAHKNKQYHVGYFDNIQDCENAVKKMRDSLHGEFANHASNPQLTPQTITQ